ncbi:MAG TPA: hypothetical protein VEZ26_08625, partial [Sphingomonadaceae bacterium]|nr:hypothetical protein [Sphingomonadaceae bacterium]
MAASQAREDRMMERNVEMAGGAGLGRRTVLASAAAVALLALPGCETMRRYSLVDAVRRLLYHAQANAFARLMAPGGFWDNQLTRLDLPG